jgi:hypothetical protein
MYLFEFVEGEWQGKQKYYISLFSLNGRGSCRKCRSSQQKFGSSMWMYTCEMSVLLSLSSLNIVTIQNESLLTKYLGK